MGRVVLAAPDVDVVVFKQLSTHYGKTADAATLYVSSGDRALDLSQVLQKSDRAGFSPPVTVIKDVDTVDATGVDLSLIGHGYFSEVEEVIRDMKLFLEGQIRPAQRSLRAVESPDGDHWAL
jgi:esterase/lipase superfamily enzyme